VSAVDGFRVIRETLSDGSHVFNVEGREEGCCVTFGAESAQHAHALADALNRCAWIEIDTPAPATKMTTLGDCLPPAVLPSDRNTWESGK